jgi:DNA-binding transcriptional LysR family regulator
MNLTTRQIRYICAVAREGSVLAASKAMAISQSSIFAAINIAEDSMRAQIFDRRPARGIVVTPAGDRFIVAARAMLAAEGEFTRAVGGLATGTPQAIRIGCFEPFGGLFMPEALRRYVDAVGPVELILMEGDQPQLREWLAAGMVDLIIGYDVGPSFGDSVTRICKVPSHAVLSVDDPLAERDAISIADIARRPFVLLDHPETATYLLTLFDVFATRPIINFRSRSYETVRSAVSARFGASILNMLPIGRATGDGDSIVRRPFIDALPLPILVIADVYGSSKPLFVRRFIEVIEGLFQEVGAARFAVSTPEQQRSLFDV